jgi:hypothetical protein
LGTNQLITTELWHSLFFCIAFTIALFGHPIQSMKPMQTVNNLLLLVIVVLFNFLPRQTSAHTSGKDTIPFSFNLDTNSRTSAGVYNTDGVLLRTLWNNIKYNEGTHSSMWDKRDDEGKLVEDSLVVIKVVSNNINYSWQGIVGNNSDNVSGPTKYHNFESISSMAANGTDMYASCEYNEAMNAQLRFKIDAPNKSLSAAPKKSYGQQTAFVATDGVTVYWAGTDPFSPDKSFSYVFGTNVQSEDEKSFSAGKYYKSSWNSVYNSIIDQLPEFHSEPTGLAVQKNGNLLFVAHGKLNRIHILNKNTGTLIKQFAISDCGQIATDADGNLWVQAGKKIVKFNVNGSGDLLSSGLEISNLEQPLAIGISADSKIIAVCDGGTSQQVKAFSTVDGSQAWTLGDPGGYSSDASVTTNKFFFNTASKIRKTFIAFEGDGSFWVGDTENFRSLKFSANRQYLRSILYMPNSRSCSVDGTNPARVTSGYLEFQIDYTKKLAPNNDSWKLVKNWSYGVSADKDGEFTRLINTTTLKNGRVYSFVQSTVEKKKEVVELPASGNIRYTGILVDETTSLYPDGNLKWVDNFTLNSPTVWQTRLLTGFDGSNNPIWSAPQTLATSPAATLEDPLFRFTVNWGANTAPVTSSDLLISYEGGSGNPDWASKKWHLGAIKLGSNKWMWKTAKGTSKSYSGDYPTDGSYDLGNGVEYPGGPILVKDQNIFWNYHGEFWKQTQTNKWQHVNDDGLLLGIFGVTGRDIVDGKQVWDQESVPGMAGNSLTAGIAKVGGDYFIYHCDESHHGGVHQWKISGLNSVRKEIISINSKLNIVLRKNQIDLKAIERSGKAQILYSIKNPDPGMNYQLERSSNNINFTPVISLTGDLSRTQSWLDNSATKGKNYYRISYKDVTGNLRFSNTSILNITGDVSKIEIAPNPSSGNNLSVKLQNAPEGNYVLRLLNNSQQVTLQKTIFHSGNTADYLISGLSNLPKGIYHLLIEGNILLFRKLILD